MFLYRSNRAERMLSELATLVAEPPADPFAQECIVVQSQGMSRYVAMRLAERLAVWGNPSFPFPRAVLEQICDRVLGPDEAGLLTRRSMTWTLAELLWVGRDEPVFAPLSAYFRDDATGDKLLQLAERLAGLFDDYAVYRDAMVASWEQGEAPDDAQAELWRRLVTDSGASHMGARLKRLIAALTQGADVSSLPSRVSLFGLSTLPPLYLRAFSALSTWVPVHMFSLSPCQEYWVDVMTPVRLEKTALSEQRTAEELHLDVGHRLLASLGSVGKELALLLEQVGEPRDGDVEAYEDPGHGCMLHALQSDILNLVERGGEVPRQVVSDDDHSIEVHICHSPMREVEVLHDQLLSLFEDGTVAPEDVVVMAPDIEVYAPLVTAVFGRHSGRTPIPYRLSDRSAAALDPVIDALRAVLSLLQGRLPLPEVLDVLSRPVVMGRFAISEDELPQIRDWANRSGMRWGADAEHRVEVGQPDTDQNTLRFGLERLLLGFAMEGDGVRSFAERLPFDDVEGGEGALLGRFAAFGRCLLALRGRLPKQPTVEAFAAYVLEVVKELLDPDEAYAESEQRIRRAVVEMAQDAKAAKFEREIGIASLSRLLIARLSESDGARGFLSGGVTFCQMLPMRSIPFSVVVLLGMEDGSFPRISRPLSFDKQRDAPKLGDRRLRDDDRYLFLEAILSARRKLMVSYVGRSVHDNSEWPPSVVLAELLDTLLRSFETPDGVSRHVCVQHPLSAMSPRYFSGAEPRLFTYAGHLRDAARAVAGPRVLRPFLDFEPRINITAAQPPIELSLSQFERFVSEPIKTFMRSRLALSLGQDAEPLASREPFDPSPLEQHYLGSAILDLLQRGHDEATAFASLRGAGMLPLGTLGTVAFAQHFQQAKAIVEHVAALAPEHERLPDAAFEFQFGRVRVTGVLDQIFQRYMLQAQYSKVERRSELRLWVRHVVLNWLSESGAAGRPGETLLVGRKGRDVVRVHFARVPDIGQVLRGLCGFVEDAYEGPVPFTAGAGRGFVSAEQVQEGKRRTTPMSAAATAFAQTFEQEDPYLGLAIDEIGPFLARHEADFGRHARTIFEPLLAAREELE